MGKGKRFGWDERDYVASCCTLIELTLRRSFQGSGIPIKQIC
jgi:hypothetical protein